MKRARKFLVNTVILTATALFIRMVDVWYSVFISGKIGTEAMGLYQLILSVYMLAITFATSGINLSATRLTAEEIGRGSASGVKSAMRKCMGYSAFFGFASCAVLYAAAPLIGEHWLGDLKTISSLRILSFGLPCLAFSSAMNGYFTAVRRVTTSAFSQVMEQLLKIGLTLIGLIVFQPQGMEPVCLVVVCASIGAELLSFGYSVISYLTDKHKYYGVVPKGDQPPSPKLTRKMLRISLPIALTTYMRMGLVTIEHILIPIRLKLFGVSSKNALSVYGAIQGIVMPVILFPMAFLQAFSNMLVPELSEQMARCGQGKIKQSVRINYIISRVFQITLIFSIGVSGIIALFAERLSAAIYNGDPQVTFFLQLLAPLIPVMYLDHAVDCMLKGLNEQVSSMRYNIIDAAICVVMVYTLLPVWGINGYIVVIFVSELFNTFLSVRRLVVVANFRVRAGDWVVKPILCILLAAVGTNMVLELFPAVGSPVLGAVTAIALAAAVYLLLIRITNAFTGEDVRWAKQVVRG